MATGHQLPLGIKGPVDQARRAALSRDGTRVAATCADRGIWVWNLATGEPSTLERQAKELDLYVGFSPDGKRLVSMSIQEGNFPDHLDSQTMRVWDLGSQNVVARFEKLSYTRSSPEFSPDGKLVAVACYGQGVVRVFEVATAGEAFSCKYGEGHVTHVVFSPDGKRLAACGERGLRLWDVASSEVVATWPTATNVGYFLAYSPDGRRLALGGIEGAVELWNTSTGQKMGTFNGHAGVIHMVAFSPDGDRLVSAGIDGTVRVWDTTGRSESAPLSAAT